MELPIALIDRVVMSLARLTNKVPACTNQLNPYTPPNLSMKSVGLDALNFPLTDPCRPGVICSARLNPPAKSRNTSCTLSPLA
ncbi:hypothetical protein D3C87_1404140 [compost metagenome]